MGKCCECGEKIEYNQFRKVDGKIYCLKCTPEKELDPEVVKAEKEAEEQFKETMKGHGTVESFNAYEGEMKEVSDLDIQKKIAEEEELEKKKVVEKLETTIKDSGVNFSELASALSTVDKKSRKKRSKK